MKRELIVFGTLTYLVMDVYHDGKYSKKLKKYKKHVKIAAILFFGLSLHLFNKKHPEQTYSTVSHMNGMIKHLPINKESVDLLTPILSMADKKTSVYNMTTPPQVKRMHQSGNSNSRCVSGTKKKYVAAQQNWRCKNCDKQLNAWYEVDHVIRLEHGGSNHVTNLVALCRDCHGEKTTLESL
jgi:hypothetical protein|tara:strand:+ start:601 stop:1146 length:546 start_codon:yes stop_codon:yes gene_type:complete